MVGDLLGGTPKGMPPSREREETRTICKKQTHIILNINIYREFLKKKIGGFKL